MQIKNNPRGEYFCVMADCMYKQNMAHRFTKIIVLICACLILTFESSCTSAKKGSTYYAYIPYDDIVKNPFQNPVVAHLESDLYEKSVKLFQAESELQQLKEDLNKLTKQALVEDKNQKNEAFNKVVDFVHVSSEGNLNKEQAKHVVIETFKHSDKPLLMLSIFKIESNFKIDLVNGCSGATGIGQVMPSNIKLLRQCGVPISNQKDLKHLPLGIKAADKMLDIHIEDANGDLRKGLYGYLGAKKPKYANMVMADVDKLKRLVGNVDLKRKIKEM